MRRNVKTGHEQLIVTVTDQSRRYVSGLQQNDFRIYVDGIQQPVRSLRHDLSIPVSVGIVVDSSGSMRSKIPQARMAIERFVGDLDPRDDIFLLVFSTRIFLLQPFTTSHSILRHRFSGCEKQGFDFFPARLGTGVSLRTPHCFVASHGAVDASPLDALLCESISSSRAAETLNSGFAQPKGAP
jgi:VWFA-related protein